MQADLHRICLCGATPEEGELVQALRDSMGRFADDHIAARRFDLAKRIPTDVLTGLADMGLFGLSIPERVGGAGFSMQGVCSTIQALAAHDRSVATTVGLHLGLGSRGLVRYGSAELKERILPELASGERIAAFAATEPGAGSDLAAISTRAVPDGDDVLVDGGKIYVTNGGLAHYITIVASSPGLGGARRGHSLLMLEKDDLGLQVGAEEDKLGLRASSTTTLYFEGLRVPQHRVIGTPGKGMEHLAHVLSWGRTVMAAGCTGSARAALDAAVQHVCERRQFRRTLGSFEVVRQQVATMAALQYAMETLVRYTAMTAGTGEDLEDLAFPDAPLVFRSTAAKVFCSEAAWEICDTALQLFGGSGFIEETTLPLLLRDARIPRIFEGANDVLAVHAGSIEALAPQPRATLAGLSDNGVTPLLQAADAFHEQVAAYRAELLATHGIKLMRQQRLQHRLGHLAILREVTDAAVLRAHVSGNAEDHALAEHWLALARARASILLDAPPALAPIDAIANRCMSSCQ